MYITKIEIEHFRGVTGHLTLNLGASVNGRLPILLLHGDNGTGKSSIVDALEFCLQGRLNRQKGFTQPEVPLLLSIGAKSGYTSVEFDNGRIEKRNFFIEENKGLSVKPAGNLPEFRISPIILRRADILSFWDTAEHQRQIVFADFILSASHQGELNEFNQGRINELERRQAAIKTERQRFIAEIAVFLNISTVEIPLEIQSFLKFIKDNVYSGLTQQDRQNVRDKGNFIKNIPKQIVEAYKNVEKLTRELMQVRTLLKQVANAKPPARFNAVRDLLIAAEKELTAAFQVISPFGTQVEQLKILSGNIGKVDLDISVILVGDKTINPRRVFSEANRDLLALLVFLTIIYESGMRGQNKFLILDDVFQSVDAGIRLRVAEYIFKKFVDWQLVVTTHDRLWHQQLRELSRSHNKPLYDYTVLRWDSSVGPIIAGATDDPRSRLKKSIQEGDSISICAHGGLLLELLCQEMTINLAVSIPRRAGDKYTLGDMWPGLFKVLKRSSLKLFAEEVERWSLLRNLAGAHYNAWAQNVSLTEAIGFGSSVLNLLDATKCNKCSNFIQISNKTQGLACKCGHLAVSDYKP